MALSRRSSGRFQSAIWPGFVDAMTGLLLVLMFVLTIFMVIQFVLRETITGQENELDNLSNELSFFTAALGATQSQSASLATTLDGANAEISSQASRIADLLNLNTAQAAELDDAEGRITAFETQVAGLLAERDAAQQQIAGLEADQTLSLIHI